MSWIIPRKIFLTQELKPGLPRYRLSLHHVSYPGSPSNTCSSVLFYAINILEQLLNSRQHFGTMTTKYINKIKPVPVLKEFAIW